MEMFNEVILMQTLYMIICFSAFIPDVQMRFYLGYVAIIIVGIHLAVSLFMIFGSTFLETKMKCKRRIMRRNFKKSRLQLQNKLRDSHKSRKARLVKLQQESTVAAEASVDEPSIEEVEKKCPTDVL